MNVALTANPAKASRIVTGPQKARPEGELFHRTAKLDGTRFDDAALTVAATIATRTRVKRRDHKGEFLEELSPDGLVFEKDDDFPLLIDHAQSARTTIGRAYDLTVSGDAINAMLRFSLADDVQPVIQRVKDGTLPHLSIGYRVEVWSESTVGGVRTKTATRWHLLEVSVVPVPADRNATITKRDNDMDPTENEPTLAQRRTEIRSIATAAGMTREQADSMIDRDLDATAARAEAFEHMQNRPTPRIRVTGSHDDPAVIVTRASDALSFRMGASAELPDASREYMHMSLLDLARDSLTRSGVSVRGLSTDEIIHRAAHGTSDFPLLVSNAAGKSAAEGYKAAESPLKKLCRSTTLSNFKPSTSIRLGEMGRLEPLSEHGEFKATSRAENGESIQLHTYGRRFDVTRQLIIDDDLGLLGDITRALGEAAGQTEADKIVSLLTDATLTLSDGQPLFHATHGNIGDGTALSAENAGDKIVAARTLMRKTKGLDGKTIIDAAPKYLICGPDSEADAEELLGLIYPTKSEDVSVLAQKFDLIVEPRIEGDRWYLLADPAKAAVLKIAHLAGASGPQIQRSETWDSLGLSFRCFLDFGTGYAGYRGAFAGGIWAD